MFSPPQKGLKNFKDDFWLTLNAGYNAFFELDKKKEGIISLNSGFSLIYFLPIFLLEVSI